MRTQEFTKERDEPAARDKCWQGVLASWQANAQLPGKRSSFGAGWAAESDYHARHVRDAEAKRRAPGPKEDHPSLDATENFAAVNDGDHVSKPPVGPMALTMRWYAEQAKCPIEERERDAFMRGWNGAALWNNARQAERNYAAAMTARRVFMKSVGSMLDATMAFHEARHLLGELGATGRCVACGQQDDVFCIGGEMACIDCIEARVEAAETDVAAVRELVHVQLGESLSDACRRLRAAARLDTGRTDLKERIQAAYERGALHVIDRLFDHGEEEAAGIVMDVFHVIYTADGYRIDPKLPSTVQCVADLSRDTPVDTPLRRRATKDNED